MALVVVGAGAFAWATTPVPSLQASALVATTTVYYADGETVMGELNNGGIDRKPLESTQMPAVAKQAAVASEDRTFFQNKGVSVTGLGRAVWGVVTGNPNLGGGSTITQQYVKNITGNDQRAYTRKATEAIQALKVDQQYEKDEILTSYLNTVYFGRGAYGIGAAAEAYFGLQDASQLTAPQAALLIGILPAPSAWDPSLSAESAASAQKRYSYVMGAMAEMGSISAADVAANPTMPGVVEQQKQEWQKGTNGYLLDAVVAEVAKQGLTVSSLDDTNRTITTGDEVATAGLNIMSTIEEPKQRAAVAAMDDEDNYPTRNRPAGVRAGLVSVDPATGGVVAMYGGPDRSNPATAFDAVRQATVQAGSTFKPVTLLAALDDEDADITLASTFNGRSPQTFAGTPIKNFGSGRGAQYGDINLVTATAKSVNTAYMELNEEIGPETTAAAAEKLGITMDDSAKSAVSNVLGSSAVSPLQMAQAYAALANGGTVRPAHFVQVVSGSDGHEYYRDPQKQSQPFKTESVTDTVYAMQAVTKAGGTAPDVGKAFGKRPIAGKTGTTNENRGAWFNGFTPQLQATVVLYNSGEGGAEEPLGSWGGVEQVTGGTFPSRIWTAYMREALQDSEIEQFPTPSRQVSSSPSPTATATPTPTETATATPSESPSEGTTPTEDGDGQDQPGEGQDGGDGEPTDEPAVAVGAPGTVVERVANRAAAAGPQGGPGRGGERPGQGAGPGRG